MKAKWMTFLVGVIVLVGVLLAGYPCVSAAPPTGEVKTVASMWGNHRPIPHLEITQGCDWMQLLYDHVTAQNAKGELTPDMSLAHKWEMSPDGLTWTFHLRKGVKFHNGLEITAKDVKFSIENSLLPESVSTNAKFIRRDVKSVEVKDPYTLVIHCKKPAIFLPDLLSNMPGLDGMVVPKDHYEKLGKDEFAKHPIGSGPYKWHSQMPGAFVKLEATDKHWRDGVPRFKYMTYQVIPEESTRIAMLRTGEADISRISRDAVKEAQSAGLNIITKDSASFVYLMPNRQWENKGFSDIGFRKALNLAIDKEAIIKHIFAGMAKPVVQYPGSNVSVIGGDRGLKRYPYDPKEAARLVKEGGWEGYQFDLISYNRAGCPEYPRVVEAVAGYWIKAGLKPKLILTEFAMWRKKMNAGKTKDTVHGSNDATAPNVGVLLPKFMDRWYTKNSRTRVSEPELDERFEKINKSLDINEVAKLLGEVWLWAYENYSLVPICEIPDKIATTKRIPKWDPGRRRNDRNYIGLISQ